MQTHTSETVVIPELQQFEKQVHAANTLFCQLAWQHASKDIQQKYAPYALEKKKCEIALKAYVYGTNKHGLYPLGRLFEEVLDPLVDISENYDDEWSDTQNSGHVLRLASYAGCMMGGNACLGDLEYEIMLAEESSHWNEHALHPATIYAEYRNNQPARMIEFLNDQLVESIKRLRHADLGCGQRNSVNYGPSVWTYNTSRRPVLSEEIINTGYHLYYSLLAFVQPLAGIA